MVTGVRMYTMMAMILIFGSMTVVMIFGSMAMVMIFGSMAMAVAMAMAMIMTSAFDVVMCTMHQTLTSHQMDDKVQE